MATRVFINIPTSDLDRSIAFYQALGYELNPAFTDENAACIVVSDTIYFMILTREYFQTFLEKPVGDNMKMTQSIYAFGLESREAVDQLCARASAAGALNLREAQDYGFMYQRALEDPDGHNLEFFWMDPKAVEEGPPDMVA